MKILKFRKDAKSEYTERIGQLRKKLQELFRSRKFLEYTTEKGISLRQRKLAHRARRF